MSGHIHEQNDLRHAANEEDNSDRSTKPIRSASSPRLDNELTTRTFDWHSYARKRFDRTHEDTACSCPGLGEVIASPPREPGETAARFSGAPLHQSAEADAQLGWRRFRFANREKVVDDEDISVTGYGIL